jgi:Ca-activated chloride channel family protein
LGRLLLLGFLLASVARPEGPFHGAVLRSDSNLVLISATVVDNSDHFVSHLRKDDFQLYERGVGQRIASFAAEDIPISAVVVFDASGSMAGSIPLAGQALREFLNTSNPADEFAIVTVRDHPELTMPFAPLSDEVADRVAAIRPGGQTALLDSVYMAAQYARQGKNPRKAVLIISDGEDNDSRYTELELLRMLRESDVTLYSIGVDVSPAPFSPDGPVQTGADVLADLAESTGGRYFEAYSPKDLPKIMSGIDIRFEYVLGYSPEPLRPDGRYHRVELKLAPEARRRHLRAYSRPGYYAPLVESARR